MTDESKQLLLDYFMGLSPNESGKSEQIIKNIKRINQSIYNDFLPKNYTTINIENIIQMPQNINETIIAYGGYMIGEESYGLIILMNNEFKPIKSFFEFNSGTKLRYIDCMYVDNEGNIYAVDDEIYTPSTKGQMTSEKRFLYLNNFTIKSNITNNYTLVLNKSYKLKDFNIYCHDIMKSPNSSSFALGGGRYDKDNGQQTSSIIISLKVKTAEENEWKKWVTSGKYYRYGGFYATWDGDDEEIDFKALFSVYENNKTNVYYCGKNGDTLSVQLILTSDLKDGIILQNLQRQVVFMSKDELYFVLTNSAYQNDNCATLIYKYKNNILQKIYENIVPYVSSYQEQINLFNVNGNLYVTKKINLGNEVKYYVSNEIIKFVLINTFSSGNNAFLKSLIVRKFNLLSYLMTTSNFSRTMKAKEVNKLNDYNGPQYRDKNSLISNSNEIYSNDELVFARDLYNKTINDNTTISTVEIPNTYLNDIYLTNKNLVSKTNESIIEDTNIIQKNIYEAVYLNFINTINVVIRINDDIGLHYIKNKDASILLNKSINDPIDYDQIKFTKARLNYQDGTYEIINVTKKKIIKGDYEVMISFKLLKEGKDIEWISENQSHVYSKIDISDCEIGKTYSLRQIVKKGDDLNEFNIYKL